MNEYISVLKKYAVFDGRASRREFWMFALFNFLISVVLSAISQGLGTIYSLAVIIPNIALGARRLHDIGRSGWWQLIAFIPIIGWIVLLVWAIRKGAQGANQYGSPAPLHN